MTIKAAFNLKTWIEEHREQLRPPVGNQVVYTDNKDYIVMCIGGPNVRSDFHVNQKEELFYQLEGDIEVIIMENGKRRSIAIKEGDIFLLPGNIPHSPRRPANTVGLVIEIRRAADVQDGFLWFCEKCDALLYKEYLHIHDIVKQLPPIFDRFWSDKAHTVCSRCGQEHSRS